MALVNGKTYRFASRADSGRSLNVYAAAGSAPSLSNVCLWTSSSTDTGQQWVYKKVGNNEYLVCKENGSVALALYTGSASGQTNVNAHVYAPSSSSYLKFEETDSGYVKIRLANYSNKYLTANQGSNGTGNGRTAGSAGNVNWYAGGLTDHSQEWWPIPVDGGGGGEPVVPGDGQYLALPINQCTITAMYQEDSYPAYNHEYDAAGHFGLDMFGSVNPFYASGIGKVIGVGGTQTTGVGYWAAVQYDNVYTWSMSNDSLKKIPSIVMRYFHLQSTPKLTPGQRVDMDTVIGTFSNTGILQAQGMKPHLHVEVDTDVSHPLYTPTLSRAAGGLYAGTRGSGNSTIDPCSVFFIKDSAPENQTLTYQQSYCEDHRSELYINVAKMNKFKEQKMSKYA